MGLRSERKWPEPDKNSLGGNMATLTLERPQPSEVPCARTLHIIQKGYAIWIGFLLFLYSALFFTLTFFGPHLQPLATLYTGGALWPIGRKRPRSSSTLVKPFGWRFWSCCWVRQFLASS